MQSLRQCSGPFGGEVAEWFKAHAWKACVANPYRGFESPPLRHSSPGPSKATPVRRSRNLTASLSGVSCAPAGAHGDTLPIEALLMEAAAKRRALHQTRLEVEPDP